MGIVESTSTVLSNNTVSVLPDLFSPIRVELDAVSDRLQKELRHDDPFVDELARHCFRMGGKRLRPAILLLTAEAAGGINESHRLLAAVVEMIHTATLVHDDVLDDAQIRRHEATAKARWDNHASVLLGDFLFSHAFYLASTLETTYGARTIGQATNIVCEGELKQTAASGNFQLSLDEYFHIIRSKTAELCACCCQLGAHYAGAHSDLTNSLREYGMHLGIAFQIADDLLDLEGDEQVTGKSLGTDLINRKMTLPLIHLRDQLTQSQRTKLKSLLAEPTPQNTAVLIDWLTNSGALEHSGQVASQHVEQAVEHLGSLPPSRAKNALQQIAAFSAHRQS